MGAMLPEEDLVEGAKKVVSKTLSLGELELAKCPVLTHLHGLEQLDLQRNEMVCIPQATLPLSIRKLTLTGNLLEELPGDLVGLTHLEELYAGANRLTSLKPLLQCRPLLHAGLCYNCIDTLPSLVTLQQLVSLDLSHNKLCNLVEVVERLKLLPELRNLCLKGNPFCLGPAYWPTVVQALPRLKLLDGQDVAQHCTLHNSAADTQAQAPQPDASSTAQPASGPTSSPEASASAQIRRPSMQPASKPALTPMPEARSAAQQPAAVSTIMDLAIAAENEVSQNQDQPSNPSSMNSLRLTVEFRQLDVSSLTGTTADAPANPSPAPGAATSIPQTPSPGANARPEADIPPASAASATPKAATPARGPSPAPGASSGTLPVGASAAPTPASSGPVETRYHLSFHHPEGYPVCGLPVVLRPAAGEADATAKGTKLAKQGSVAPLGKAKPGAGVEAPAPPLPQGSCSAVWTLPINAQVRDWIRDGIRLSLIRTTTSAGPEWSAQATQATAGAGSRQEVVAEGVFRALAVLDGVTRQVAQPVRFLALPDLWDERKLRLPLDDQRHAHRQVAMLQASLRVHPGE